MPKSGIGRAIVLGIILGILLVFAVGVAGAQEREPVRALEGKLCYVDGELGVWLAGTKGIPSANIPAAVRARIGAIGGALEGLCAEEERLASADDRERLGWLLRADSQCEYLSDTLREALEAPQTTASRRHLAKLASHAAHLQSVVREFRFLHGYSRVEVREKEVVRTVQVAAQCPDPEPVRESPCVTPLRQGARRWADQLYSWTSGYQGSGQDWQLARNSSSDLYRVADGKVDAVPYVVGWLSQWRVVRRDQSFLGSGPMPQIAADMRAQLQFCGVVQPDWDR